MNDYPRIYLSSPHIGESERRYVQEAFDTNWVAPLGPNVDRFEEEFARYVGTKHAAALSSGTAAIHLALELAGVGAGDEVICSSLTFVASVNPIRYVGATPVLVDSEPDSWNICPDLLAEFLARRSEVNRIPKALVLVHLYGQSANIEPIMALANEYGIVVIEDAAEALGATYKERSPGSFGKAGVFSFNGNKIITTSGGGMLVSDDESLIKHARKLATQARDPAPYYEHSEVGYNYRMSNVLAGIGRGQLEVIEDRVAARRAVFQRYTDELSDLPMSFQPEASWGRHTRWLTCLTLDEPEHQPEDVRQYLERTNIEARPVWKPMHLQPLYAGCEMVGGSVCQRLFSRGLCLPSGSNMTAEEQTRVIVALREFFERD
jgi:dTDP-4-amino-4,6-dideoxygalactose transaminase